MTDTCHQLKITLRSVEPQVWRRIVVRSDTTLGDLAAILEAAMGWLGRHLHAFEIDRTWYGMPDPDAPSDQLDENSHRIGDVLAVVGAQMRWDYDFGDGWEHDVVVESIDRPDPSAKYPLCLEGGRACPPEDSGGPPGYADLLAVLADPGHPEHEDLVEWAPPNFDPDVFDIDAANLAMKSPRPAEGWWV